MSAYTPGEWEIRDMWEMFQRVDVYTGQLSKTHRSVASVAHVYGSSHEEAIANAQLVQGRVEDA